MKKVFVLIMVIVSCQAHAMDSGTQGSRGAYDMYLATVKEYESYMGQNYDARASNLVNTTFILKLMASNASREIESKSTLSDCFDCLGLGASYWAIAINLGRFGKKSPEELKQLESLNRRL